MSEQVTLAVETPLAAPIVEPKPVREPAKPDRGGNYLGTGRRKTSIARVRMKPGTGKFVVNGKELANYFSELRDQGDAIAPLKLTNLADKFDVSVTTEGGGVSGQAGAIKMGLARALQGWDPSLHDILRDNEMLTRDAREVERKKYGRAGARRRFQFSKR